MRRVALPGLACALALAVVGCGPTHTPLPPRLDPETQKQLDESWAKAFTPADRLDRPGLLDVMVGTQAYQLGVDTFSLKAEKAVGGGTTVVTEVGFDRAKPDGDRFEVTVRDAAGKVVRREKYGRAEVQAAHDALFVNAPPPKDPAVPDKPEAAARRADYDARWKKIQELFPKAADPPAAPTPAPKVQG